MRSIGAIRVSAVCLAAAVIATGCSDVDLPLHDELVDPGLVGPDHFREICVSRRYADAFTVGVATATNKSDESLELMDLTLTKSDGITLEGADFLIRDDRLDSFGVWNGYPPKGFKKEPLFVDLWSKRMPIEGGTVEPGEEAQLPAVSDGRTWHRYSGPIEVTYQDESGDTGTWLSNVTYRIMYRCRID